MILSAIAERLKRRSKDDFKGRHFEASLILQAVYGPTRAGLSPAGTRQLLLTHHNPRFGKSREPVRRNGSTVALVHKRRRDRQIRISRRFLQTVGSAAVLQSRVACIIPDDGA